MNLVLKLKNGTEIFYITGDVDALENGGGVLYRDPFSRKFHWSFWESRELGQKNFEVFTCPVGGDILSKFEEDLESASLVSGISPVQLRKLSRSKNPVERVEFLEVMKDTLGSSGVDPASCPDLLSPFEMVEKWGEVFGVSEDEVPMIEFDDYLVRQIDGDKFECGCMDGTFLGRFQALKHALCVIADDMSQRGNLESNVFMEHDFMEIELMKWERETFAGKYTPGRGKLPVAQWRTLTKKYLPSSNRSEGMNRSMRSEKSVMKNQKRSRAKTRQKEKIERVRAFGKRIRGDR